MHRLPRRLPAVAGVVLIGLVLAGCGGGDNDEVTDMADRLIRHDLPLEPLDYPVTPTVDLTDMIHGTQIADPYRWLEDSDSERTRAWIEAQNEVTFGLLESIPEREAFRERLTELWDYERYSAPLRRGERIFYYRNDGLQDQSVLYVQDAPDAEPRVLLDPNTLSEDGTVSLGDMALTRDGRSMAWAASESGSDWRTLYIRDVATGEDLADRIEWVKFSDISWDQEGDGFYYSRYAAPAAGEVGEGALYDQKLYYHRLGTGQDEDALVYERPDQPEWGFGGHVSDDGRYLVITVWQGTSNNNRLYYKDLSDSSDTVHKLCDAFDASYDFIGNDGDVFFVRTNKDAPREKVVAIDLRQPAPAHWTDLIPESEDPITSVTILDHSFVVTTMHDVVDQVKIHELDGSFKRRIELPGLGSVGGFSGFPEDAETYFVFTSYLNPSEIYHYDFRTGRSTLHRAPEIDFDFAGYETRQVFYTSKDGTRIPMFLVHREDLELDGNNPTLLYGYGGFNISLRPYFSTALLPWLERGGVYASANLRGGGEYGEQWHQAGMLDRKQNVFDDFITAAEYLIREGYTRADKLAIHGGSNGGTLVGAVVNQRPELFAAAIPAVGVMDMLRYEEFTIGWAWASDFGSVEDPEMFRVLRAYSPYHNLKEGVDYPAVMVTTADHDDRVVPGHSFKYAARLQACQTGNLPVVIRIQTKSGHGAGKPTGMIIEETADRFAFLHRMLAMGDD